MGVVFGFVGPGIHVMGFSLGLRGDTVGAVRTGGEGSAGEAQVVWTWGRLCPGSDADENDDAEKGDDGNEFEHGDQTDGVKVYLYTPASQKRSGCSPRRVM